MAMLRTRWGQFLVAAGAYAGLMLVITLMPSLTVAGTMALLLREGLLIFGTAGAMVVLIRAGAVSADTLGWRRPNWRTVGWGLVCLLTMFAASGVMVLIMRHFGVAQNTAVLQSLANRPAWMLVLIALTAAISEEIVFRGILLNCLAAASGRVWVGAGVSLTLFAISHMGTWGLSQVLFACAPGAVLTLFFLWKRDLGVCMIAHFLTDALGLLGAMMRYHHG